MDGGGWRGTKERRVDGLGERRREEQEEKHAEQKKRTLFHGRSSPLGCNAFACINVHEALCTRDQHMTPDLYYVVLVGWSPD